MLFRVTLKLMTLLLLFPVTLFAETGKTPSVQLGIDQLLTPTYFPLLKDKRVGLMANSASVNAHGESTITVLSQHPDIKLTALFTPEHGLSAQSDRLINDGRDSKTGLAVYSLYGPRRTPTAKQWESIDVLVIDLQDVGVRYYTFGSTLALLLKSAKHYDKTIIVLDRVNPLSGTRVEGLLLNPARAGQFTAYYPIIMRHGLTFGELALFYNIHYGIYAKLHVVPL